MPKSNLSQPIGRISQIANDMERFVPIETRGVSDFRAELAGLLVVSIAASYEECVKATMVEYASRRHLEFEKFTERNYSRLSSKVKVNDLHRYTKLFGPEVEGRFKELLTRRKSRISSLLGVNIEKKYEQILSWRHDYAHAGIKNTTIHEALDFHRFGSRVIYCFNEAFDC